MNILIGEGGGDGRDLINKTVLYNVYLYRYFTTIITRILSLQPFTALTLRLQLKKGHHHFFIR